MKRVLADRVIVLDELSKELERLGYKCRMEPPPIENGKYVLVCEGGLHVKSYVDEIIGEASEDDLYLRLRVRFLHPYGLEEWLRKLNKTLNEIFLENRDVNVSSHTESAIINVRISGEEVPENLAEKIKKIIPWDIK